MNKSITTVVVAIWSCLILCNAVAEKPSWSHFEERDGRQKLIVNEQPFLILGVEDYNGTMRGTWHEWTSGPFERFFQEAAALGFNTIHCVFPWYDVEVDDGTFDFSQLQWMKEQAEANDLKIGLVWIGSSFSHSSLSAPPYIASNPFTYQRIMQPDGIVSAGVCWNHPEVLEKETRALKTVMSWLKQMDTHSTYITIQLENEIGLKDFPAGRCQCAKCDADFKPSIYKSEEAFEYAKNRKYIQSLAKAVHEVMPGFPCFMNSWDDNIGAPGRDVAGWLRDCPDIAFIGPDIYGESIAYRDHYAVSRNIPVVTEHGVESGPWITIFEFLGKPYYGRGDVSFQLQGGALSLFIGYCDQLVPWHRWPFTYDARDSFYGLRCAAPQIAKAQGTDSLATFVRSGGEFNLGDVLVTVKPTGKTDGKAIETTNITRGLIVRTGDRDYTFVGVAHEATVHADVRTWNLKAERGRWEGDSWRKTVPALAGSVRVAADGKPTVTMSPDSRLDDMSQMQYCLRLCDAGKGVPSSEPIQLWKTSESVAGELRVAIDPCQQLVETAVQYYIKKPGGRDYRNAANTALRALEQFPESSWAPYAGLVAGASLVGLGEKDAAKKTLRTVLSTYPDTEIAAAAAQLLVTVEATTGADAERLLDMAKEIYERYPRTIPAAQMMGAAAANLANLGRYDEAIALLDEQTKTFPAKRLILRNEAAKGDILYRQAERAIAAGDVREAKRLLESVVKDYPQSRYVYVAKRRLAEFK